MKKNHLQAEETMMRSIASLVLGLSVSIFATPRSPPYESKRHSAYAKARRLSGDEQRLQQKTAYVMYQQAIKAHPNRISAKLRERFIEMCLVRAHMVLSEGSADMDALPLFLKDLDNLWGQDVSPQSQNHYADLLVRMADSSLADGMVVKTLEWIDKALSVTQDKAKYQQIRSELIRKVAQENIDLATMEFEDGKLNEDLEQILRAEYHAKLVLELDPQNAEAQKLLSTVLQKNSNTYSAYLRVIDPIVDSTLFKKINKYDILLAVATRLGGTYKVSMFNNSYNPQRLRHSNFFLVDVDGNKYPAAANSKVEPEILDQERETNLILYFPKASKEIKKIAYENGEHYTEKAFF